MSLARISVDDAVLDEPKSTVIGTRHIKHYALRIEKSLMKKLNSASITVSTAH
jgi:predicted Rossmann fold nucleotide-binding protein DprA/Smf involved in DNA uptake